MVQKLRCRARTAPLWCHARSRLRYQSRTSTIASGGKARLILRRPQSEPVCTWRVGGGGSLERTRLAWNSL